MRLPIQLQLFCPISVQDFLQFGAIVEYFEH